ncbi:unnamed protein product, partial [Rotaria sp. Silwood2]
FTVDICIKQNGEPNPTDYSIVNLCPSAVTNNCLHINIRSKKYYFGFYSDDLQSITTALLNRRGYFDQLSINRWVKSSCEILEIARLAGHFKFDVGSPLSDSGPNSITNTIVHLSTSSLGTGSECFPLLGFASNGTIIAQVLIDNNIVVALKGPTLPVSSSWIEHEVKQMN